MESKPSWSELVDAIVAYGRENGLDGLRQYAKDQANEATQRKDARIISRPNSTQRLVEFNGLSFTTECDDVLLGSIVMVDGVQHCICQIGVPAATLASGDLQHDVTLRPTASFVEI